MKYTRSYQAVGARRLSGLTDGFPRAPVCYMGAGRGGTEMVENKHGKGTIVPEKIKTTTWTSAGSPYHVICPTEVVTGERLAIESGAQIVFDVDVQFVVKGEMVVKGERGSEVVFRPGDSGEWRGIRIMGGGMHSLKHTRVSGGHARGDGSDSRGGGVHVDNESAHLTMCDCVISDNVAEDDGGGLDILDAADVFLTNCVLSGNTSRGGHGGGAYVAKTPLNMVGCKVLSNRSEADRSRGGGIYLAGNVPARLRECDILENGTKGRGGGVCASEKTTSLHCYDTRIEGNESRNDGGGLDAQRLSSVRLLACQIKRNTSHSGHGGGLYASETELHMDRCSVEYNCAKSGIYKGGGLHLAGGVKATLRQCKLLNNTASHQGGGLYASCRDGHIVCEECVLGFNSSQTNDGSGVELDGQFAGTFKRCLVCANNAKDNGALAFNGGAEITLDRCTVASNTMSETNGSSGIYCGGGARATLRNSIVWGNTSPTFKLSGSDLIDISYSCVDRHAGPELGKVLRPGHDVIYSDPRFRNADMHDYHLTNGSPCIDAGDPRDPDPDGSRPDLGALPYDGVPTS